MLRNLTVNRMNNAIRACLDECYAADNPLATMAEFVRRLRQNPQWRESEIDEVEVTVRRMLRVMVVRHTEDKLSPLSRHPARVG